MPQADLVIFFLQSEFRRGHTSLPLSLSTLQTYSPAYTSPEHASTFMTISRLSYDLFTLFVFLRPSLKSVKDAACTCQASHSLFPSHRDCFRFLLFLSSFIVYSPSSYPPFYPSGRFVLRGGQLFFSLVRVSTASCALFPSLLQAMLAVSRLRDRHRPCERTSFDSKRSDGDRSELTFLSSLPSLSNPSSRAELRFSERRIYLIPNGEAETLTCKPKERRSLSSAHLSSLLLLLLPSPRKLDLLLPSSRQDANRTDTDL